jgi:hypothetical protein
LIKEKSFYNCCSINILMNQNAKIILGTVISLSLGCLIYYGIRKKPMIYYNTSDQPAAQALATKLGLQAVLAPTTKPSNLTGSFLIGGPVATNAPSWWAPLFPAIPTGATTLTGIAGNHCGGSYYIGTFNGVNLVFGLHTADTLTCANSYPNCPA